MENNVDDLRLQNDLSSYSSFYKTQLSLPRDESSMNEKTEKNNNHEDSKGTAKNGTKPDEASTDDNAHVADKTSSDMNNNSNDDKDKLTNKLSSVEQNKDTDGQLEEINNAPHNTLEKSVKAVHQTDDNKENHEEENDEVRLNENELTTSDGMSKDQHDYTDKIPGLPAERKQVVTENNSADENYKQSKHVLKSADSSDSNGNSHKIGKDIKETGNENLKDIQEAGHEIRKDIQVAGNEIRKDIQEADREDSTLQLSADDKPATQRTKDDLYNDDIKARATDHIQQEEKFLKELKENRDVSMVNSGESTGTHKTSPRAQDVSEERNVQRESSQYATQPTLANGGEVVEKNIEMDDELTGGSRCSDETNKQDNEPRLKEDATEEAFLNHSGERVKNSTDDQTLLKQTSTHLEDISKPAEISTFPENVPTTPQPSVDGESKKMKIGGSLSISAEKEISTVLEKKDITQTPNIEKDNSSESNFRKGKYQVEMHGVEASTSSKKEKADSILYQTNDEKEESTRAVSRDKEKSVIETPLNNDTVHRVQLDQRHEGENENIRLFSDEKKNTGKEIGRIYVETHLYNSESRNKNNEIEHTNVQPFKEKVDNSETDTSTYDNLYFTGRLPSILSRDDSSQSIDDAHKKKKGGEAIVEETEKDSETKTPEMLRENDKQVSVDRNERENALVMAEGGKEHKPEKTKIPAPSREIKELIEEIKGAPYNNIHPLPGETHLSPTRSFRRNSSATLSHDFDAITEVQKENEPFTSKQNDDKNESANMTVEDIRTVTSKVLGTTYAEDHKTKFDNLPHMKQISDYVQENLKTEDKISTPQALDSTTINSFDVSNKESSQRSKERKGHLDNRITKENDVLPHKNKLSPQHSPKKPPTKIKFLERYDHFNDKMHQSEPCQANTMRHNLEKPEDKQVQRSSSENDLKQIIASAKIAINSGTETTESHTGFATSDTSGLTLQGDTMSLVRNRTRSRVQPKGVWSTPTQSDNQEALSSLICSNCLQVDSDIHSAGYCLNCQQYLCKTCITVHTVDSDTRLHEIIPSYCKNELAANKYIPATGYCVDCCMFLCKKCVVQHIGFRANRHHRIIQSSFVSKSSDKKFEEDAFPDELKDKIDPNDDKASVQSKKERKGKRKLLSDLDHSNPYGVSFDHVPESLYPGPNKKLASSYTKHPKWAHSSIPNLPYLVQPKPIPDRVFHAAGHHRPLMIYTKPKTGIDAMAAKFKSLKSRYKIKDEVKTIRRREQASFTARPAKDRENLSLPDVQSVQSHFSGGRSIKHVAEQNTSTGRKEVEFINEHCLSIPFPRGEKRTDIMAMTILLNGKLAVLDKNNNNVKLFNKTFHCVAALQFQNRLVDICASNLCPTDLFAATSKHIYEISAQKGMEIKRKMKVEIKRIEGMVSWKYGLAIVSKKTNITWELRLLDYRGNLKSKLEIFNPLTLDIASSSLHHMTSSRGGKYISLSDTRNSCIVTVDVTTRVVVHETMLEEGKHPTYITSDGEGNHNLYVSCANKVFQISRKGKVIGVLIDKDKENGEIGCILYNKENDRMYVKTGKDMISVYQIYF